MYPLQLNFIPTLLSYEDYHNEERVEKAVHHGAKTYKRSYGQEQRV